MIHVHEHHPCFKKITSTSKTCWVNFKCQKCLADSACQMSISNKHLTFVLTNKEIGQNYCNNNNKSLYKEQLV